MRLPSRLEHGDNGGDTLDGVRAASPTTSFASVKRIRVPLSGKAHVLGHSIKSELLRVWPRVILSELER